MEMGNNFLFLSHPLGICASAPAIIAMIQVDGIMVLLPYHSMVIL